jgi:small subunit ribosomal protein S20
MANIKANIKSIRRTQRQQKINSHYISTLRTKAKKVKTTNEPKHLHDSYKTIDSLCAKGKIHKNKANRIKSRLALTINKNSTKKAKNEKEN